MEGGVLPMRSYGPPNAGRLNPSQRHLQRSRPTPCAEQETKSIKLAPAEISRSVGLVPARLSAHRKLEDVPTSYWQVMVTSSGPRKSRQRVKSLGKAECTVEDEPQVTDCPASVGEVTAVTRRPRRGSKKGFDILGAPSVACSNPARTSTVMEV